MSFGSTLHKRPTKMKTLAITLFSTLLSLSNAGYWEAGPCPPKPPVVTPFEVERVSRLHSGLKHNLA